MTDLNVIAFQDSLLDELLHLPSEFLRDAVLAGHLSGYFRYVLILEHIDGVVVVQYFQVDTQDWMVHAVVQEGL